MTAITATMTAAAGSSPGGRPAGEVVGVPSADGSPPYIIKWLKDGHIAMVLPDQYSRIVPAGETVTGGSGAAA